MQGISEAFLHPVLESVIAQFPFELAGFHSDSGAEYINASVVRKHMGFAHIPQKHAARINAFYQQTFNPWLNLHRPCMYATEVISPKGKIVKRYKHEDVKTPLECLVMLCQKGLVTLKKGITLASLQTQANANTDLAAAQEMQRAKRDLFASFVKQKRRA